MACPSPPKEQPPPGSESLLRALVREQQRFGLINLQGRGQSDGRAREIFPNVMPILEWRSAAGVFSAVDSYCITVRGMSWAALRQVRGGGGTAQVGSHLLQ